MSQYGKQPSQRFLLLWQYALASLSLLAILLHLIFKHLGLPEQWPLFFVIIIGGLPLLIQIFKDLLQGDWGADLLAALALLLAIYVGQYLAAVLIILMLSSGQALETYAMRKASAVLLALAERMPTIVHRKQKEYIEDINLADVQINDVIVIYPHEVCPVDGIVIDGHGSMDESYLTGEPYRISKAPGVAVLSGAINGEALLLVRTEKLPADSRYAEIIAVMSQAEQKRPAMRRLADQLGAIFAPLSLLIALLTWYLSGDIVRFLAVLVVATPCPLLIAIPITLISAISMSARQSIIIKDPTVLERLPTCRTAIFDKTGTLTYGNPVLTEVIAIAGVESDSILQQAASIERYSKHPLASAIVKAANQAKLVLAEALSVTEKPGQGLTGIVAGHEISIVHRKWLEQTQSDFIEELPEVKAGLECVILLDGRYVATFRFRDAPRAEGKSFIEHLAPKHQFNKVILVSGDRETEVSYLADLLGITETLSSQSPEQKLALVQQETAHAPTLFMGDGINDAPALAVATVGVAFGQQSSVASEAAGAVILENSLVKVDELFHISAAMRRIALQSAVGGIGLSVIGMTFAAFGFITPVTGALLQEVIDVVAILNALRMAWLHRIEIDLHHKHVQ